MKSKINKNVYTRALFLFLYCGLDGCTRACENCYGPPPIGHWSIFNSAAVLVFHISSTYKLPGTHYTGSQEKFPLRKAVAATASICQV